MGTSVIKMSIKRGIDILITDVPIFIYSHDVYFISILAHAQLHQDSLGSLKMALIQRRNM
jgi:hypothetical protein